MAALHAAAPSAACLPRSLLCLHPLASSLPVSNSDQSGGKGLVEEAHIEQQPVGVSAQPDCGFRNLSVPAADHEFVRDFSSYFELLPPWEI